MEHVSKEENRPKEGYLTEESAYEASLVMKLKYGKPFGVYKCEVCHFWHIGRVHTEEGITEGK